MKLAPKLALIVVGGAVLCCGGLTTCGALTSTETPVPDTTAPWSRQPTSAASLATNGPADETGGAQERDRRYSSCAEARRNGAGPYLRGVDPEYGWYRDEDGDGRVCER